jgi:hypothetical protein
MSNKVYRPWVGTTISPNTGDVTCMIDEGVAAFLDGDEYVRQGEHLSPRSADWHDTREAAVAALRDKLEAVATKIIVQASKVK